MLNHWLLEKAWTAVPSCLCSWYEGQGGLVPSSPVRCSAVGNIFFFRQQPQECEIGGCVRAKWEYQCNINTFVETMLKCVNCVTSLFTNRCVASCIPRNLHCFLTYYCKIDYRHGNTLLGGPSAFVKATLHTRGPKGVSFLYWKCVDWARWWNCEDNSSNACIISYSFDFCNVCESL